MIINFIDQNKNIKFVFQCGWYSEQHLVDCVYGDKGGCGGGFMGTAYNYFLYGNPNVAKGDLYPYETQVDIFKAV